MSWGLCSKRRILWVESLLLVDVVIRCISPHIEILTPSQGWQRFLLCCYSPGYSHLPVLQQNQPGRRSILGDFGPETETPAPWWDPHVIHFWPLQSWRQNPKGIELPIASSPNQPCYIRVLSFKTQYLGCFEVIPCLFKVTLFLCIQRSHFEFFLASN